MPYKVKGPDLLSLGWIPLYRRLAHLPAGGYQECLLRYRGLRRQGMKAALRSIFCSGNIPARNEVWDDHNQFRLWLDREEYRGAALLSSVELICNDDGSAVDVVAMSLPPHMHVGATPLNFPLFTKYDQGRGHSDLSRSVEGDTGILRIHVEFRIGKLGNVVSYALTGHGAPYAWMDLAYRIRSDQSIIVEVNGSFIPSHRTAVPSHQSDLHRMEYNTAEQVSGFLMAGNGLLAPGRGIATLHGTGTLVQMPEWTL